MVFVAEVGSLMLAVVILVILFYFLKNAVHLIINSVIGIIIMVVLNMFLLRDVVINIWSIAIVALAGIPGVVLVLIIHFLGLGF